MQQAWKAWITWRDIAAELRHMHGMGRWVMHCMLHRLMGKAWRSWRWYAAWETAEQDSCDHAAAKWVHRRRSVELQVRDSGITQQRKIDVFHWWCRCYVERLLDCDIAACWRGKGPLHGGIHIPDVAGKIYDRMQFVASYIGKGAMTQHKTKQS